MLQNRYAKTLLEVPDDPRQYVIEGEQGIDHDDPFSLPLRKACVSLPHPFMEGSIFPLEPVLLTHTFTLAVLGTAAKSLIDGAIE